MRTARSDIDMEDLAVRMRELDEDAYHVFADHFGPRFRSMFCRRGLRLMDAEDLAASCVTDIALKVEQYKSVERGGFRAWVFTLARNSLRDWFRALKGTESLPEDLSTSIPDESEFEDDSEIISAVRDAIGRLPESDREVIQTKALGGEQTFAETGATLGVSGTAARQRYHRALKRLEALLGQDERIIRHLARRGVSSTERTHE
ncbi:MAG: sigma-70 family RNA polymerase sigma factor [Acidobacteria bacterium]|nr:sigma-70 family RNA polymerase sigma factor [Acidobacteriota bacterium]